MERRGVRAQELRLSAIHGIVGTVGEVLFQGNQVSHVGIFSVLGKMSSSSATSQQITQNMEPSSPASSDMMNLIFLVHV